MQCNESWQAGEDKLLANDNAARGQRSEERWGHEEEEVETNIENRDFSLPSSFN